MNNTSDRLSVTPVGRAVAKTILHPYSANQLLLYAATHAEALSQIAEHGDDALLFVLAHAAYSSHEYTVRGNARVLPYQLNSRVTNELADQCNQYLMDKPWYRYPTPANAAMVVTRWAQGLPTDQLASEFNEIGSGMLRSMAWEGAGILHAWAECLSVAASVRYADDDRPSAFHGRGNICSELRNLLPAIQVQVQRLNFGLPGECVWLANVLDPGTRRSVLQRNVILDLYKNGLTDWTKLLQQETYRKIVAILRSRGVVDADEVAKRFLDAVREYRDQDRKRLWDISIECAPQQFQGIINGLRDARRERFESGFRDLLDKIGISYTWLDNGEESGRPDLVLGEKGRIRVVMELKTALDEGTINFNRARAVISSASTAGYAELPKVTVGHPAFDPNVPWQARRAKDLGLVEACELVYGLSMVIKNEIDEEKFIAWLAQPGMLYARDLTR